MLPARHGQAHWKLKTLFLLGRYLELGLGYRGFFFSVYPCDLYLGSFFSYFQPSRIRISALVLPLRFQAADLFLYLYTFEPFFFFFFWTRLINTDERNFHHPSPPFTNHNELTLKFTPSLIAFDYWFQPVIDCFYPLP